MKKVISVILLSFFGCSLLNAQAVSSAQIKGIVQDSSGSAVPDASVKVTQTATGATRSVTSAADGNYIFPELPIGPYTLEVSKDVPLIGLDPKGKNIAQLLVFTWFPGDEKPSKKLIDGLPKSGTVYTDSVLTDPVAFTLDPKLAESCKK